MSADVNTNKPKDHKKNSASFDSNINLNKVKKMKKNEPSASTFKQNSLIAEENLPKLQ